MTDPFVRRCANCGLVEVRRLDPRGREETNLDPISGTCISCLIASSRLARGLSMPGREATENATRQQIDAWRAEPAPALFDEAFEEDARAKS